MRTYSVLFFLIAFFPNLCSQELITDKEVEILTGKPLDLSHGNSIAKTSDSVSGRLVYDCNAVFWTINVTGQIQQWNLIANQVTGGSIVQNCIATSLAFCGEDDSLTFYATDYPSTGILKYNDNVGWTTIPTSIPLVNNGGYHENQYYFYAAGGSAPRDLYHFDGVNLSLVIQLTGLERFMVADVAVDSLGRAWVFTGTSYLNTNALRVYDQNGLVNSYPLLFNDSHCYGSFFINNQLYLGFGETSPIYPNAIVPVMISGTNATLGSPIPFQNNNFADIASCNVQSTLHLESNSFNKDWLVYPNPASSVLNINHKNGSFPQQVRIFNAIGELVHVQKTEGQLNVTQLPKGFYILEITSEDKKLFKKFVKE